jgi:hypothetical protein
MHVHHSPDVPCCIPRRSLVASALFHLLLPARSIRYMLEHGSYELVSVRVFEEEGDCIVCLEMRADKLMRRLISGELTIYSVVRTSPEPLQYRQIVLLVSAAKPPDTL